MRITNQLQAMLHAERMEAERRDFQKWWTPIMNRLTCWSPEELAALETISWAAWRKAREPMDKVPDFNS